MLFAEVVLPLKFYRTLTYRVPVSLEKKLKTGDIVLCPLKAKAYKWGCVIQLHSEEPDFKIKDIVKKADNLYQIPQDILQLTQWISQYYCQAPGLILDHASFWSLTPPDIKWRKYLSLNTLPFKESVAKSIYQACLDLKSAKFLTKPAFLKKRGITEKVVQHFLQEKIISQIELPGLLSGEEALRLTSDIPQMPAFHDLTKAQKKLKEKFFQQRQKKKNNTFLLHGITGSGKTELYCHIIEEVLKEGGDIIFLVPEVSLVGQTVRYLQDRFGNLVSWYHYLRTASDKLIVSWLIRQRKIRILVGTRSAIFAPFSNPGLILVDEEHSASYKAENNLSYNARDVAVYRGHQQNVPVILGSATPSVESYYQAQKGKYTYLLLPERFNLNPLPPIHIIDLKENFRQYDPQTMMCQFLKKQIQQTLYNKGQVLLFFNRRGFSTFQMCLQCGKPVMCRYCHITLTYHKQNKKLKCHYCGFQCAPTQKCYHCQSKEVQFFGSGTQKIEEKIREEFPEEGVLRIDSDVIHSRKKLKEVDGLIQSDGYRILIGTQMITKGLHLEKLALVGILDVDYLLTLPDFRSAEKTFSLILQAAGRAGRSHYPGKVYIQSFMKKHNVFRAVENHNYEDFYRPEIKFRRSFLFPPFTRLIKVIISGRKESDVKNTCQGIAGYLAEHPQKDYHLIGPSRCPIEKIKGRYRYMCLVKYQYPSPIQKILTHVLSHFSSFSTSSSCSIQVDCDPLNFL